MEIKTFTTMDSNELEQLAKKHFKIQYEYVAEEELSNDTQKSYNVNQKDIDDFDWEEWAEFLEGKRMYRAHTLITRLVMLKAIPMGDILVDHSW